MKCPNCPVELVIDHTGKIVEGDNSPDTPTKVYEQQYFICPNRQCSKYGQIVEGEPILIFDSGTPQSTERQILIDETLVKES